VIGSAKVFLFTHCIGFGDPAPEFIIEVVLRLKSEVVQVIARGEGLDPVKPGMIVPAGKHESAHQARLSGIQRDKPHARLEGDAGFWGDDGDRAALPHHTGKLPKDAVDDGVLAGKQVFEVVLAARMPLIRGRKFRPAFLALP